MISKTTCIYMSYEFKFTAALWSRCSDAFYGKVRMPRPTVSTMRIKFTSIWVPKIFLHLFFGNIRYQYLCHQVH